MSMEVFPYPAGAETSTSFLSRNSNIISSKRGRVKISSRRLGTMTLVRLIGMLPVVLITLVDSDTKSDNLQSDFSPIPLFNPMGSTCSSLAGLKHKTLGMYHLKSLAVLQSCSLTEPFTMLRAPASSVPLQKQVPCRKAKAPIFWLSLSIHQQPYADCSSIYRCH